MGKKLIGLIVTIIVVVALFFMAFGLTYSYFLMARDTGDMSNSSTGGKLEIIYTNGQNISGTLLAYTDNSRALSTTATIRKTSASVDALATITLHVSAISSELATNAFKWEVYENSGTTPVNSGTFNGVSASDTINVISNYELTTTDTVFTVKLWIDSALTQGSVANKTFSGYIDASAINKAASTN